MADMAGFEICPTTATLCTGPPLSGSRRACRDPLICDRSALRYTTKANSEAAPATVLPAQSSSTSASSARRSSRLRVCSFITTREVIEGTVSQDAGAQIRDGIKSVAKVGAPPESDWPYNIAKFAVRPPPKAYRDSKQDLVSAYSRVVQDVTQMRGCLAEGYPFVFGFTVYQSFESETVARTGLVPMPGTGEAVLGGHCVVAVGYDNSKRRFIIRNSWGTGWGLHGYCLMPYEYLINPRLASDFWTIRSVSG